MASFISSLSDGGKDRDELAMFPSTKMSISRHVTVTVSFEGAPVLVRQHFGGRSKSLGRHLCQRMEETSDLGMAIELSVPEVLEVSSPVVGRVPSALISEDIVRAMVNQYLFIVIKH